jgi:hypothetical protein
MTLDITEDEKLALAVELKRTIESDRSLPAVAANPNPEEHPWQDQAA